MRSPLFRRVERGAVAGLVVAAAAVAEAGCAASSGGESTTVSRAALERSVLSGLQQNAPPHSAATDDGVKSFSCSSDGDAKWVCELSQDLAIVPDVDVTYEVEVTGSQCWTARRTSSTGDDSVFDTGGFLPERAQGCVGRGSLTGDSVAVAAALERKLSRQFRQAVKRMHISLDRVGYTPIKGRRVTAQCRGNLASGAGRCVVSQSVRALHPFSTETELADWRYTLTRNGSCFTARLSSLAGAADVDKPGDRSQRPVHRFRLCP
jgi:hypothetical protein